MDRENKSKWSTGNKTNRRLPPGSGESPRERHSPGPFSSPPRHPSAVGTRDGRLLQDPSSGGRRDTPGFLPGHQLPSWEISGTGRAAQGSLCPGPSTPTRASTHAFRLMVGQAESWAISRGFVQTHTFSPVAQGKGRFWEEWCSQLYWGHKFSWIWQQQRSSVKQVIASGPRPGVAWTSPEPGFCPGSPAVL